MRAARPSRPGGGNSRCGFLGGVARVAPMAVGRDDVFLPRQFDNPDNCEAHELTTDVELLAQLTAFERQLRAFVRPDCRVNPLEP